LTGAAAMAGAKAFDLTLKSVGLSTKLIPEKTRAAFFDKANQAVEVGYKAVKSNFRNAINQLVEKYPDKSVSFTGVMARIGNMFEKIDDTLIPQLKTALARSPKLAKAVDDPMSVDKLTLREAQDLKNAITSTTNVVTNRATKGKATPNDTVLFELLDEIDDKITQAFPQMSEVRKAYSEGKKAYEMARPLVQPGTAVESSIMSKPQGFFGMSGTQFMSSTQERLAAKKIMSMTEPGKKMFEAAKLAHNLNRAADTIGRFSEVLGGGTLVGIAGKKLFGKKN